MKKILSLLALLVMTVTAFAADYVGHRTVTYGANPPTESEDAVLKITDNGNNTYNVTFENVINVDGTYTDNYGTYTFSNVAGTTTDGLTTIDLTGLTASVTNCDFGLTSSSDCVLFAKFNAEKAYARLEVEFWGATVTTVFGTDDFSTGGGSTTDPVVDPTQPVDLVEAGYNPGGEAFLFHAPIDWNTQKLVAKLDLSTCKNELAPNEGVFTCGSENLEWDVDVFTFFKKENKTLQSYTGGVNTGQKTIDTAEPVYIELSKANGYSINNGLQTIDPSKLSQVFALSTIYVGGPSGTQASNATYNYVKVVPLDWTEPTEPETPTVTFEKTYTDHYYNPTDMGETTVTLREMSDNTVSMYMDVQGFIMSSTDLVKGTDEKGRTTYTGTANFVDENTYAVKALRYTENEEEKLYATFTSDALTLTFGTDPDYVAPVPVEDVTLWENYQADGNGFSQTATIDWDKQKIVASIDFSDGGDDKDILAMTTGESFSAFQTTTYRTMHWYCNQTAKQMSGFFAKSNAGNNNTGRMDVANCLAKFEISKAEGLKVNGEVKMTPAVLEDLFASNTLLIGSGESPKFSKSFYNYVKIVSLDWTEPTVPTVEDTKDYEANAMTQYVAGEESGAVVQYMKDAKVKLEKYSDNTYTATLYGVVAGADMASLGDITLAGLVENDGVYTLTEAKDVTIAAPGSSFDGKTYSVQRLNIQPNEDNLLVQLVMGNTADGSMLAYQFGNVFIPVTQNFTNEAHVTLGDATTDYTDAKVELTEFMEDVYRLTYKNLTVGEQTGDFVIDNLRATVDADNNVTFSTEETGADWGEAYKTFSDLTITAVKGAEGFENLVVKFTTEGANVVFGEALPTPPVTVVTEKNFTDKLYMVSDEVKEEVGQARVTIKEMSDKTNNMTISIATGEEAEELSASGLTKTVDAEKNRTTYTGTLAIEGEDFNVNALVYTEGEEEKIYMVAVGSYFNYVLGTNPDAAEVTEVSNNTYTSNLRVYDADSQEEEPVNVVEKDEAVVNIVKYSDDTYKVTLKDIAWGENPATDLVFLGKADSGIMSGELDGEDETAQRTSIMAVPDDDTAAVLGEGVQAMFQWIEKAEDAIEMAFYLQIGTTTYAGEFNYEKTPEEQEPFCKEKYVADGNGFEWEINVDWDTQKIVMSIDPSTCTGDCEHIIGLGAAPTTFHGNLHLYRTSADQMLQGYFETSAGNNNTGKFAETTPFLVEVSKAQGFVVNDEVKIAASAMSDLFTLSTVKMGTGEGNNQLSRATYNYVKVVDKDWTAPKDPETGIGAIEAAYSDAQIFTVNGVKLNKLQKGLNIVRTADGKVKKVLVK